jgi:diguanylate cyclase (GGDEF)-like protein/putative nucleotidyltransferase with HDIG domain
MPIKAKLFVTMVVLAGCVALRDSVFHPMPIDWVRFACFAGISLISSGFKVRLPGIEGTMSVNFLFILIGIVQLSLLETLAIAFMSAAMQTFWKKEKLPQPIQVAFNFSMIAAAIVVSYHVYWWTVGASGQNLPLALVAIATTYFLANTVPVGVIISLTEKKPFTKIWAECYFWSFPHYLVGAAFAGFLGLVSKNTGWQKSLLVLPFVYLIYRSYRVYLERLEAEKDHVEDMASLHLRTIEALALAIEAKDHATHDHLHRVRAYAVEIGKALGLTKEELEALKAASLLHDIGKLAVPEHIINKPGRLTPEEFEKMKIHPFVGAEILRRVSFPYPVVPIVECHHERWDGTGYPFGLQKDDIPIGARILSAVDCLDALASERQYRRAVPLADALKIVVAQAGTQFDPKVVKVLEENFERLEQLAQETISKAVKAEFSTKSTEHYVEPAAGFEVPDLSATDSNFLSSIAAARQEAQTLYELSHDLGNSLSLDETLSLLSVRMRRLVPYDSIAVFVTGEDRLKPQYVAGDHFRVLSTLDIKIGQGISGWVAQTKTPIFNGNPSLECAEGSDRGRLDELKSAVSVPLTGMGGTLGVLTLYRSEANAFSRDHLRILLAICSKIAMAIENALRFQKAESSATTDFLTDLPNARSLFVHLDRELSRCRRENLTLAVMVCDLDGFKQVNDRFGHLEGNRVLRQFAQSLSLDCREYDYVARMGGDEFVLIAPGLQPSAVAARVARINDYACQAGLQTCGEPLLSASVGVAFFHQDGNDAEQLLAAADQQMYGEKQKRHERVNTPVRTFSVPPARSGLVN